MKRSHLYILNILIFSSLATANVYAKKNEPESKNNAKNQLDQLYTFSQLDQLDLMHTPVVSGINVVTEEAVVPNVKIQKKLKNSRQENEELKKRIDLMLAKVKKQQQEIVQQEKQNASLTTNVK